MGDFIVRLSKLPRFVKAQTILDENGDYNIYVNEQLTFEQREIAIRHEVTHVAYNDWYNDIDTEIAETRAETEALG